MTSICSSPLLRLSVLLLLFAAVTLTSCSSDEEPEAIHPQIIFLFSPGGLGDMSYNDCILEGVQQFKKHNDDIDIFISSPGSIDEAERIFSDWLARPESDIPVLFVLATCDYESMTDKYLAEYALTSNKSVLLFESLRSYDNERIRTFQISMYGASYLAGVMAAECASGRKGLVVLANDSDGPTSIARDGFVAGYGNECDVEYLADDWTGYIASALAYQKMGEWAPKYGFIFPVAGGSNAGMYRYSREYDDTPFLAGMDIDQSSLSTKITGSVIKHIDMLIYKYLSEWSKTGKMPESQLYGLESGYVDWLLAPLYESRFIEIVENTRRQAIAMEKQYYGKKNN